MARDIGKITCLASFFFLLLAIALGGCKEESVPTGTLLVPFQLGNGTATCGDEGVVEVNGTLDDGKYEAEVECAEDDLSREILFSDVEEGTYSMQLFGLDEEGVPVVDTPVQPVEVKFEGEENSMTFETTISLSTAPARLEVRWNLGFGNCGSTGIDRIQVVAYGSNGMKQLLDMDLACSLAGDDDNYRQVPDPERDVDGELLDEVVLQPLDKNGVEIGDPVIFDLDPPGAGRTVQLSITCTAAGCQEAET